MRIAPSERVLYENNPLAEVVCQVRFERLTLEDDVIASFGSALTQSSYPNAYAEDTAQIAVLVSTGGGGEVRREAPPRVYHFASSDHTWRVSLSAEFIALTCKKYISWGDFKPRMLQASRLAGEMLGAPECVRVGLRYKDVVEREPVGLAGTPWRDLFAPFVLGPLGATELAAEGAVPEGDISSFVFQSNIRLDDCKLLLQGGLLTSVEGNRQAFLIDSDFYLDGDVPSHCLSDPPLLDSTLERLHTNAGALFGKTISRTLHAALRPRPNG